MGQHPDEAARQKGRPGYEVELRAAAEPESTVLLFVVTAEGLPPDFRTALVAVTSGKASRLDEMVSLDPSLQITVAPTSATYGR